MPAITLGAMNRLAVLRKTDIGYMLKSNEEEVFLHNNESMHKPLKEGDFVDAFLYVDQKGRTAATLHQPIITIKKADWVEVSSILPNLGVFVDIGISKDALVSKDFLPYDVNLWPQVGDQLYCILKIKGKMVAKPLNKFDITLSPSEPLNALDEVEAFVMKIGQAGVNLMTEVGHPIFVHKTLMRNTPRLGEAILVSIQKVLDNGEYNGTLIKAKEDMIGSDSERILAYLIENKGAMPYNNDTDPEAILAQFNMSKKAFKRALGHLYKARKITFSNDMTLLVKE